jgi:tripartite-type tricarboxylate transporter receptor subunit TctC
MSNASAVKTLEDARKTEATLASTGAGSASSNYPTVLNNVVGTKFKLILGYRGSNDAMLAVERGEAEGHSTAWNTLKVAKPEWVGERKINMLVQFALNRHPELGDVPTAIELGRGDEDRQVLKAIMSASEIGTAFFTSPGVPTDRVTALRRAFDATMKDPAFLADAEKAKFSVGPMTGEDVQKLVAEVDALPGPIVQKIRSAFVFSPPK